MAQIKGAISVAGNRAIHVHAPGIDAPLQVPHLGMAVLLDQPATEMPAAHPGVTEHRHRLLALDQAVDLADPVLGAAQGQMQHRMGQLGQLQLVVLAHIHQLDRFPGQQPGLQVAGADRQRRR